MKVIIIQIIDGEITRKILTKAVALASKTQGVITIQRKKIVVVVIKIVKTQAVKRVITRKKEKVKSRITREINHHHLLVIVILLRAMMVQMMIHYRMKILIGEVVMKMTILIQMYWGAICLSLKNLC